MQTDNLLVLSRKTVSRVFTENNTLHNRRNLEADSAAEEPHQVPLLSANKKKTEKTVRTGTRTGQASVWIVGSEFNLRTLKARTTSLVQAIGGGGVTV